jgi:AcrR family transcriptional regulator
VTVGTAPQHRPGRTGVTETALRLFAEHGVDGTSLQMIADAMGVAKAAVYYHYKTKDEILLGVLAPVLDELPGLLERARGHRGRTARADALLVGLVDLVLDHGPRFSVISGDPYIPQVMGQQSWVLEWWGEAVRILAGPDPTPGDMVAISMLMAGLAAPSRDPMVPALDPAELRRLILDSARRLVRLPRRT